MIARLSVAGLVLERYNSNHLLLPSSPTAGCDAAAKPPSTPSWWRRHLSWIIALPIPRVLVKNDSVFVHGGLVQRERDATRLRELLLHPKVQQARTLRDMPALNEVAHQITCITYGKGLTPQDREDFLARYGCTGWTLEVLETILELAKDRGVVEIGAGHGQWARALNDLHNESNLQKKDFEFVTAFDNMAELPLNPNIYRKTQPAHDYFYPKVQQCKNSFEVLEKPANQGRVLMLVFPSAGSTMALDSLKAYVATGENHDTIIYVGEGRGGANAPDEFFDYLEDNKWILLKVMQVKPFGTKGYEKLYILKRPPSVPADENNLFSTLHEQQP